MAIGQFSGLLRMLALDIGLPLIAVQVALRAGLSPIVALCLAAIFPLADALVGSVVARRVSIIAGVSLAAIFTGLGLALFTGNAAFAILKDSAFTFIFSLVFLGSLASSRPLVYGLYHQMVSPQSGAQLDRAWDAQPGMRHVFGLMTLVWGLGLFAEASLRAIVTFSTPVAIATAASPWISFVFFAALIAWTVIYARARQRAAARAGVSLP